MTNSGIMEAVDHQSPDRVLMEKEETVEVTNIRGLKFRTDQVIALANFASSYPEKWKTVQMKMACPEATCREIGAMLGIDGATVSRHLTSIRIEMRRVIRSKHHAA